MEEEGYVDISDIPGHPGRSGKIVGINPSQVDKTPRPGGLVPGIITILQDPCAAINGQRSEVGDAGHFAATMA